MMVDVYSVKFFALLIGALFVLGAFANDAKAGELSPQSAFEMCDAAVLDHMEKSPNDTLIIHAKSVTNDNPYNVVDICYETSVNEYGIVLLFARCPLDMNGSIKFVQVYDRFDSIRYCRSPTRWQGGGNVQRR
ncbi:hypothetical protein [Azospirillum argentinense]